MAMATATATTKTTLLTLPAELRLSIFNYVLLMPRDPSSGHDIAGNTSDTILNSNTNNNGIMKGVSIIRSELASLFNSARNYDDKSNGTAGDGGHVWMETDDVRYTSWTRGERILYAMDPRVYESNVSSLLLVCRCFYDEVKLVVRASASSSSSLLSKTNRCAINCGDSVCHCAARTGPNQFPSHSVDLDRDASTRMARVGRPGLKIRYDLSLTLLRGGHTKLEWTSVPVKTEHIDELRISLHSFALGKKQQQKDASMRSMLSDRRKHERPSLGWLLWSVLERFLLVGVHSPITQPFLQSKTKQSSHDSAVDIGPVDASSDDGYAWYSNTNVKFRVNTVTFDIVTEAVEKVDPLNSDDPSSGEVSFSDVPEKLSFRSQGRLPLDVESTFDAVSMTTREYHLCQILVDRELVLEMQVLVFWALYESFGQNLLYERVGRIQVSRDGILLDERDLGYLLQRLEERHDVSISERHNWRQLVHRGRGAAHEEWRKETMAVRKEMMLSQAGHDADE